MNRKYEILEEQEQKGVIKIPKKIKTTVKKRTNETAFITCPVAWIGKKVVVEVE